MPGRAVTTTFWSRLVMNTPQATVSGSRSKALADTSAQSVAPADSSAVMGMFEPNDDADSETGSF